MAGVKRRSGGSRVGAGAPRRKSVLVDGNKVKIVRLEPDGTPVDSQTGVVSVNPKNGVLTIYMNATSLIVSLVTEQTSRSLADPQISVE